MLLFIFFRCAVFFIKIERTKNVESPTERWGFSQYLLYGERTEANIILIRYYFLQVSIAFAFNGHGNCYDINFLSTLNHVDYLKSLFAMITLEKHNNALEVVNDCERQKVSHQKGSRAFVIRNSKGQFVEFNKLWKKHVGSSSWGNFQR